MLRIITLLVFCCACFNTNADEIQLQKNYPERYVVVKGDTLWGISGKFLKNPWLWPKIWNMNRAEIKNPHWIYPGDVVVLDNINGKPQLRLLRETVTLQPGTVIESLDKQPIQTIAPSIITPFLSQPLLIENGQLDNSPRIIAGQDNRVILSPGTRVYISDLPQNKGLNWFVYRPGEPLIDPDTQKILGVEATYLGDARVTKLGNPATGEITRAKEEIFTKDRLVSAPDVLETNFVPHAPEINVRGRIIKIYGGVLEGGPSSVVSINRGRLEGLEVGHVLAISHYGHIIQDPEYKKNSGKIENTKRKDLNVEVNNSKDGQVKLPDERVGLMMIFKTFDHVSYGLVMEATDSIITLDAVHNP